MRNIYILSVLTSVLLFGAANAFAQELGKPFLKNFSPKEYKAAMQNWAIAQDNRGVMYFGNHAGLLEYDGIKWELTPSTHSVQALAIDDKGIIYVGSTSDFGYMKPDSIGKLKYHSLLKSLSEADKDLLNVAKIHAMPDGVYFQSYQNIVRWKNGKIDTWKPQGFSFHLSFLVGKDLYVKEIGGNLYIKKGEGFESIPGSEKISESLVYGMLPYGDRGDKFLICTETEGLYIYDMAKPAAEAFYPFHTEAEALLKEKHLYSAERLPNGDFALGTLGGGVLVINKQGRLLQKIDAYAGLQNETVYSLFVDAQQSLWAALDNGISHIEADSPFSWWDEDSGLKGIALSLARHDGMLYVATTTGIFSLNHGLFKPVKGISGQTWDMVSANVGTSEKPVEKLLAANSDGIFELEGDKANKVAMGDHVFKIFHSPKNRSRVYFGSSDGLHVISYKTDTKQWIEEGLVPGTKTEVRSITDDDKGNLWLGTNYIGVIKVEMPLNGGFNKAKTTLYNTSNGLPTLDFIQVYPMDDKILFATEKGIYRFDEAKNHFFPDSTWGKKLADGSTGVSLLTKDSRVNYWLRTFDEDRKWIEVYRKQTDHSYQRYGLPFKRLPDMEVFVIFPEADGVTWIGTSEGLFRYDSNIPKNYRAPFHALIREVSIGRDSVIFEGIFHKKSIDTTLVIDEIITTEQPESLRPVLHHNDNAISFHYTVPYFEKQSANQLQYILEGYDEAWSKWSMEYKKDYTNLPEGKYVFKVRARNVYGLESEESHFSFEVFPPWYSTMYAYIGYCLLGITAVWGLIKLNTQRLIKEKMQLADTIRERTAEIVVKNEELHLQKEQMASQKDKIEQAYTNVQQLSQVGREITATLSLGVLESIAYKNIKELMEVDSFGIGSFNKRKNVLEFNNFRTRETEMPFFEVKLENKNDLAAWCFLNEKPIFIQNLESEYKEYVPDLGERALLLGSKSVIYLPLFSKGKSLGVISVQNNKENAYTKDHLNFLRNVAVYTAIALENVETFELMETKNKKITDSINYAKNIQEAMLPQQDLLKDTFKEHFVFFKPRDIVSGDFYWFAEKNGLTVIAAVDCTGHGVPGAFMSMLGSSILNHLISEEGITSPDLVLNELHKSVRHALKQDITANRDGMDISLCAWDKTARILKFAGAKNPLVYIDSSTGTSELTLIKGDKTPIGGTQKENQRIFTLHEKHFPDAASIYMFTDGYQDQFGGDKDQKYTIKRFKDLLIGFHDKPMMLQQEVVSRAIAKWQGQRAKQIDDILVIGFKV